MKLKSKNVERTNKQITQLKCEVTKFINFKLNDVDKSMFLVYNLRNL